MSFKQKFTFLLAVFALVTSTVLAAGAPPNVTRVEALVQNGTLTVNWDGVTDPAGIDFYRVYFSHESILGNDGNYDDFERTTGSETTYTFSTLPLSSEKIFVSVLAVNKAGIESEGFEMEASAAVQVAPPMSSSASVSVASSVGTTAIPLEIATTEAASATGVLITFTKPLSGANQITTEFFAIVDGSGTLLPMTRIDVGMTEILLHTAPQTPTKVYVLGILQPITAMDGTNLPLSMMQQPFRGFEARVWSSSPSSVPSEMPVTGPVPSTYVRNPELPAQPTVPPVSVPLPTPVKEKPLPGSGLGATSIAVVSALLAGRKLRRKK